MGCPKRSSSGLTPKNWPEIDEQDQVTAGSLITPLFLLESLFDPKLGIVDAGGRATHRGPAYCRRVTGGRDGAKHFKVGHK
jgi:hypothetical protein